MGEYHDAFVRGLEWMWGEGFMSPGGAEEVARLLGDTPVSGAKVLDVGCGIGGIDVALVNDHGASEVIGIDVDPGLVDRATQLITEKGLNGQVSVQCVEPGPLPFADESFDVVFSKDSLVHIPDKAAIYREIFRVLRPGGFMAVSDWLGNGLPSSEVMQEWEKVLGLTFSLGTLAESVAEVERAGFINVESEDRNAWYAEDMRNEIALLSGENYPHLVAAIGEEAANQRLTSSSAKLKVVDNGELRPGHIRGQKPA